jgi:hypothetical protein
MHIKKHAILGKEAWWVLHAPIIVVSLLLIVGCGEAPPPQPTQTPHVVYVIITPTQIPITSTLKATSIPSALQPTATSIPTATPTSEVTQSGGLGLTVEEWKQAGSLNVPSAAFTQTTFLEGHASEIYIGYLEWSTSSGTPVPLEQARADSKRLLPNDAVVVTGFTVYDDAHTPSALEIYRSASLADLFKATPDAWKGGQPGTFSIYFSLYGDNNEAGNINIRIGQAEIPETDPIALVNDDDVNFREGPGFNYKSMEKLNKGTRLFVLGRDSTSKWLYVAIRDASKANLVNKEGWIMTQYTNFSGNLAALYEQSAPPTPDSNNPPESYGSGSRLLIACRRFPDQAEVGYSKAGNGSTFIIIGVGVSNTSSESVFVSPVRFTLISTSNEAVDYDSSTYSLDSYAFRGVELQPGTNTTGTLVFLVRKDFIPDRIVYQDFREPITIKLIGQ